MAKVQIHEESRTLYLARALFDAVDDCNIQQVNMLLYQNKANPNVVIAEEGMTAFHLAAGHENLPFGKIVTSLILHNGGDPNTYCVGNRTVLHIAIAWNRSSVVEILLNNPYINPNPFIKDEDGLNAFNYAMKYKAWESLAILQNYMNHSKQTSNSHNQEICKTVCSKSTEKENKILKNDRKTEKCPSVDTTFNESDKLLTSSGYLNSDESYDTNSLKSTEYYSDNQKKDSLISESLSSETVNSISDILNANISPENQLENFPSRIYFDGSIISSITDVRSINDGDDDDDDDVDDDDDDDDNDIYISLKDIVLSETSKLNEIKLSTESNTCSNNNEWMTEISEDFSNLFGSDEYFTCPDTKSEKSISSISSKTGITNKEIIPFSKSFDTNPLEVSNYQITSSDSSSSTEVTDDYDTDFVRQSLRKYGYHPGPLLPSTKHVYVRKLNEILKSQSKFQHKKHSINLDEGSYSHQLTQVLSIEESDTWIQTIKSWSSLEKDIIYDKSGPSFTYLLLDPRVTRNLPARADQINNPIKIWRIFISSIFYIGKGTNFRPKDHMTEAFNSWIEKVNKGISPKSKYILSLWKENLGVVCVQAFHHLVLKEAHIREAAMIDALGLGKLTNEKRGTYYDNTSRWRNSEHSKLGCYLLYRAMLVFLADGERQLQPIDLT